MHKLTQNKRCLLLVPHGAGQIGYRARFRPASIFGKRAKNQRFNGEKFKYRKYSEKNESS